MTAGSIAVPSIVPLRVPTYGKLKNVIDIYTPIEIKSGRWFRHVGPNISTSLAGTF